MGLTVAAAAGCGGKDDPAARGRDDYRDVYRRAMLSVAERDLEALWPLLTENGRQGLERVLRQWQGMLAGGEGGELLLQRVRERLPGVTDEEIAAAARGSLADAWRFFLRADPRPAAPKQAGMEVAPDGRGVRLLYESPDGTIREVRLVQRPSGWYVDLLQL